MQIIERCNFCNSKYRTWRLREHNDLAAGIYQCPLLTMTYILLLKYDFVVERHNQYYEETNQLYKYISIAKSYKCVKRTWSGFNCTVIRVCIYLFYRINTNILLLCLIVLIVVVFSVNQSEKQLQKTRNGTFLWHLITNLPKNGVRQIAERMSVFMTNPYLSVLSDL